MQDAQRAFHARIRQGDGTSTPESDSTPEFQFHAKATHAAAHHENIAFARQGATPNFALGAQREDIFSWALFDFFRHYWTVCINHRPHAKKKGPAWRPRQNQGPHARIYDSTPELTISTPESRPPRQNFNLHADAPRQNLGRRKETVARNAPRQNLEKPRKGYFSMWLHGACNYAAQSQHMGL